MKSYDVKFWAIRPGKARTRHTYEVRWKVGHTPHSRTLRTKAQAESFVSDLRQAARAGEAFDTDSGLPGSLATARQPRSWLEFCLAYVDSKWPSAAPKSRDSMTNALATIVAAVVDERPPDWLEEDQLRGALRRHMLDPPSRNSARWRWPSPSAGSKGTHCR
jgi:hypothetical protein